jgi:hypothetical protein
MAPETWSGWSSRTYETDGWKELALPILPALPSLPSGIEPGIGSRDNKPNNNMPHSPPQTIVA